MKFPHAVAGLALVAVAAAAMTALGSGAAPHQPTQPKGTATAVATAQAHAPAAAVAIASTANVVIDDPLATVVADPPVPRPAGSTPCVITLAQDVLLNLDNDGRQPFAYAPPAGCGGPWAKVVLEADIAFEAGAIPEPTAVAVWLDGMLLYWGATSAPPEGGVPWRVERNLTDYAARLRRAGSGYVKLDERYFQGLHTAQVRVHARLLVYPATASAPAPRKPDAVYELRPGPHTTGYLQSLYIADNGGDEVPERLSTTFTLPRDIERAFLDVTAVGGLWWSCVPDEDTYLLASHQNMQLGDCVSGGFRQLLVRIDGQPAGLAPIQPWRRGGVRALNLQPYRIDLSPFAGPLSDGAPHEISVSIVSSGRFAGFGVAATLLVYRDPHSTAVSGAVTRNTLTLPSLLPTVTKNLRTVDRRSTGDVLTTLRRSFVIDGYIDTARGRIQQRVTETVHFYNTQAFDNLRDDPAFRDHQDVRLTSKIWRNSYASLGRKVLRHDYEHLSLPLHHFSRIEYRLDGSQFYQSRTLLHDSWLQDRRYDRANIARYVARVRNHYQFAFPFDVPPMSKQTFDFSDNRGSCYSASAIQPELSGPREYETGLNCPGQQNSLRWFVQPDGSADHLGWAGWW